MIRYLTTSLYLLFSLSLIAQSNDASWTEDYKIDGYQRIVGSQDGNLFLQRSLRGHFEYREYRSELAKYDATGKVTHIIGVEKLEKRDYQELYAVDTDLGIAIIYLTTDAKSDKHFLISAQLYSHEDLTPLDIVDLMLVRYRRPYKPDIDDYDDGNSLINIEFKISEDKSKLAIIYEEERIGKDKYTVYDYGIFDLEGGLKDVKSGSVETDERSDHYITQDIAVNNNGDLALLIKEYEDDRGLEFVGKRPGYKYSIYAEPKVGESFIYDIPVKKYFIDEMLLGLSSEGEMFVTGMIRNKPGNNVYGTIFGKVSAVGELDYLIEEKYTKKEIQKIRQKEKDRIQGEYEVVDIKIAGGIAYGVYQYNTIRQDRDYNNNARLNRGFNNFDNRYARVIEYYQKQNVIIHGFDLATGDRKWTTVNLRDQSDFDDYEYFTYGNIHLHQGNLMMLYNESLDNHSRTRVGKKPRNIDFPEDRTTATLINITPTGSMFDELISDEGYFYIPNEGSYIKDEMLSMLRLKRNYKRFNIGQKTLK